MERLERRGKCIWYVDERLVFLFSICIPFLTLDLVISCCIYISIHIHVLDNPTLIFWFFHSYSNVFVFA